MKKFIFCIVICIYLLSTTLSAQTSFYQNKQTVNEFLDKLAANTQQCLNQYNITEPERLRIGAILSTAISNSRLLLTKAKYKKINALSVEKQQLLTDLQYLVNTFKGDLHTCSLRSEIQNFTNQHLQSSDIPMFVRSVSPVFLSSEQNTSVVLIGHFPNAKSNAYHPVASVTDEGSQLLVVGSSISGNNYRTNSKDHFYARVKNKKALMFTLPKTEFTTHENYFNFVNVKFELPYVVDGEQHRAPYYVTFAIPPKYPATLDVECTDIKKVNNRLKRSTKTFTQHATNGDMTEKYCLDSPTKGKIDSESIELVVKWSEGEKDEHWSYYQNTASTDTPCFTVETIHDPNGTSGKLNFTIKYEVQMQGTVKVDNNKSLNLKWGETKTIPLSSKDWELTYTPSLGEMKILDNEGVISPLTNIKVKDKMLIVTTPKLASFLGHCE